MSTVAIRALGGKATVAGDQVGDDTVTGGVGGWEQRARPRRTTMVSWAGTPGVVWSLPILLGPDADSSVERECRLLQQWGLPGKDDDQPPTLLVDAPAGRAAGGTKWVLQDIEWGEQTRNDRNDRTQQEVTLTLLEYVPGQVLKGPAARSRDKARHKWVPVSGKDRSCKVCKKPRKNPRHTNRGDD